MVTLGGDRDLASLAPTTSITNFLLIPTTRGQTAAIMVRSFESRN